MDYFSVVTVFIAITTATLGFTQYFYARIDTKDTELLNKIEGAYEIKLETNISSEILENPKGELLRDRLEKWANNFNNLKNNLENYKIDIEKDRGKEIIHGNISSLALFFIGYLIILGLAIIVTAYPSHPILIYVGYIILAFLFLTAVVLNVFLLDIFNRVKNANMYRKIWKKEIETIHDNLLRKVQDQETFERNIINIFKTKKEKLESSDELLASLSNEDISRLLKLASFLDDLSGNKESAIK